MAAPTFIQEAETVWNTSATPKTTASFAVQVGDVLVAHQVVENRFAVAVLGTPTNTGTALTWTAQEKIEVNDYPAVGLWTAVATVAESITVSFTDIDAGTTYKFGGNVFTFRGSDGVGAAEKTNVSSGAPSLSITTTQANSAIVVVGGDWNAVDGSSRTWRTGAGTLTEQTYFRDAAAYTVYGGYHADAGAISTYAVGLSAPSGQKYSIVAVEVKGTAGAAASILRQMMAHH